MPDPIEVNYVPDGDDWQVTVSGRGQQLTGRAPGLIAARDRADQLVEKVAPEQKFRTVVHLLNGDALEFTTAYLTARLGKPTDAKPAPQPSPQSSPQPPAKPAPAAADAAKPGNPAAESPKPEARHADPRRPDASTNAKPAPVRPPAPRADSDAAAPAGAKHGAGGSD